MTHTKPNKSDKVHVIVNERPRKVVVVVNDQVHHGRWRTVEAGEFGNFSKVVGNPGILHAAMCCWDGQENIFTTTFEDLELCSGGWGAWKD